MDFKRFLLVILTTFVVTSVTLARELRESLCDGFDRVVPTLTTSSLMDLADYYDAGMLVEVPTAGDDSASLVVGTGIVPLKDVMSELLLSGYDGWFCIEHFGAPNMLKYAAESIANVRAVWDEITKDHELARFLSPLRSESGPLVRLRSVAEKEQGSIRGIKGSVRA